jgi:hypothetical protein
MRVEFMDAYGRWQLLNNANAVLVRPGVYEVTIQDLSSTWGMKADMFEGAVLRVDGTETKTIVATSTEPDKVVIKARTELSQPKNDKP